LDVQRSRRYDGATVWLHARNLSGAQKWTLDKDGRVYNPGSRKFLTAQKKEGADDDTRELVIWGSFEDEKEKEVRDGDFAAVRLQDQAWLYTADGMLVHRATGNALTASTNSPTIRLGPSRGPDDLYQQWSLIPLPPSPSK
jgi:hypothetical protein